ncbi:DUF6904 family protein [Klebsiella pneumoniae]|uniref:DUF6904 family protein n=1 Tax=Klebsiella pneumoniae TaxID=573 RepID=UPI000E2CCC76|nr:hypothetical protein DR191_12760 [Klebsiella pneumoniae]UUO77960.1 hypothetical protein DR190_12755 [Klebsiella pneumoniae]UUO83617.1 hypothetical protein DR189_12760 [Klebsiella pneumoniae]UUO89280.1 hypothetical protein DR188_12750 [Klebsiella pneumoniae]SVY59773.1 Uncharacterised protein [Klebsiella pneumoniae]
MLRYELTPNNAGFVLWGDSEALDELHQLIHFLVDESPLIEGKNVIVQTSSLSHRPALSLLPKISSDCDWSCLSASSMSSLFNER